MDQSSEQPKLTQPQPVTSTKPKPKPPPKPPSPMVSAFKPVKLPPTSSKPQIGSSSAFAPVPVKPEPKPLGAIPSAYTSSATHFKPIVLHQTTAPPVDSVKEQEIATDEKKEVKDQPNEKDKEVVRKLKELKKNLMKHRQPGMAKEIENDDGKDVSNAHEKKPQTKPLIPTKDSEKEVKSADQKAGSSIDSLLAQMQKQGSIPDTQTLASAIAQHLQNFLPQGLSNSPQSGGNQVNSPQGATHQSQMFQNLNSQLPNIPAQYQQQLLGHTMTLPGMNQFGSGMMPGYPMQVQLQQDPRTGYFQLVPVGVMPRGGSAHGSRPASDEYIGHTDDHNESGRSSKPGSRAGSSDTLPRTKHGRTARDLVQKTANIRAKNAQQSIGNSPNNSSRQGNDIGSWRPRSAHSLDHSGQGADLIHGASHNAAFGVEGVDQRGGQYPEVNHPQRAAAGYNMQHPNRNRSNSSSPSPSKDSGVSGLNGVYKPPPPGSLMERLLNSNLSLTQQQKVGRVVHLLREEFAFDGYMENGVEDVNMGENFIAFCILQFVF